MSIGTSRGRYYRAYDLEMVRKSFGQFPHLLGSETFSSNLTYEL
jgi:hypothetical protein